MLCAYLSVAQTRANLASGSEQGNAGTVLLPSTSEVQVVVLTHKILLSEHRGKPELLGKNGLEKSVDPQGKSHTPNTCSA
jgi:hypothetical protein